MDNLCTQYFKSSVGKKTIMGLTGLGLCAFTLTHLLGNFLILVGADAFNMYAHKLITNPFIYVAEVGLALLFVSHIAMAMKLTFENKRARPEKYHLKVRTGRGATLASSTMPITGLILLVFTITHLINFKFGTYYTTIIEGEEVRDLYKTVVEYFRNPTWVIWYCAAMIALGVHVSHGFQSSFQSLGFNHPKYTPPIKKAGYAYAAFVTIGFSALAIYSHLQGAQ